MAQYLINRKWRRVAELAGIATLLGFCTIVGVGANRSRATVASITGRPIVSQATVDYVSVNASRGLVPQSVAVLTKSFESFGWKTMVVHQGTLDLTRVRRNIIDVQVAPSGSGFPMSSLAVDPYAIAATMGQEVQKTLSSGAIVVGVSSAQLRGAAVGDTMTITGWNGASLDVTVGAIVPDARIGGVEVVLSTTTAASIGFVRPFTIRAWASLIARAPSRRRLRSLPLGRDSDFEPDIRGFRVPWKIRSARSE